MIMFFFSYCPLQRDLFPKRTSTPGAYQGLPHKMTDHDCTIDDIADFVIDYVRTLVIALLIYLFYRSTRSKQI